MMMSNNPEEGVQNYVNSPNFLQYSQKKKKKIKKKINLSKNDIKYKNKKYIIIK